MYTAVAIYIPLQILTLQYCIIGVNSGYLDCLPSIAIGQHRSCSEVNFTSTLITCEVHNCDDLKRITAKGKRSYQVCICNNTLLIDKQIISQGNIWHAQDGSRCMTIILISH